MSVQLNHTIVKARDGRETADFIADVLGLGSPESFGDGHFLMLRLSNDVSLDVMRVDGPIDRQHCAFLVGEDEFDTILARIEARQIEYFAEPMRTRAGEINTFDGGRGLYFSSPGGHNLEILTRPYGAETEAVIPRKVDAERARRTQGDIIEDAIKKPIFDFSAAWAAGSGRKMAECFTHDAHFIAFDGTRLKGGTAIGDWHQPALDTVLRHTTLDVSVDDIEMLTADLALVTGSGGPRDDKGSERSRLAGDSYSTYLVKHLATGEWKLLSLQVTRRRQISHTATNAMIWKAFNSAWAAFVKPTST